MQASFTGILRFLNTLKWSLPLGFVQAGPLLGMLFLQLLSQQTPQHPPVTLSPTGLGYSFLVFLHDLESKATVGRSLPILFTNALALIRLSTHMCRINE